MDTEKDLYAEIGQMITEIQTNYTELVKYLDEMPDTLPDKGKGQLDLEALIKYRNSLKEMLLNYHIKH
ncbi:MAG: hypothetical protein KJ578_00330 [Bacteroidetes bacterium]|jgi:hypothetical protein|nr:hypothetical protein [Bacteroidota bacterium]MDA3943218.1 hypothetical protein [Bacteroidota bacterium]